MKKFLSIIMVLAMVLSLSITAFAAPTRNDGSITITNPTAGQEYRLYKIFDANYATGTDGKVITNADGKAVVSYSIEKTNQFFAVMFGENGDQENNFFSYDTKTGVVKIKEAIDGLYADGRTTLMGDEELEGIIAEFFPDLKKVDD